MKWRENWSKMIFEFLAPPPKKQTNRVCKTFLPNMKKSKLFKIEWDGEKIGQQHFLDFQPPPQKKKVRKIGYVKHFLPNMKKIKIVQIQSYQTL